MDGDGIFSAMSTSPQDHDVAPLNTCLEERRERFSQPLVLRNLLGDLRGGEVGIAGQRHAEIFIAAGMRPLFEGDVPLRADLARISPTRRAGCGAGRGRLPLAVLLPRHPRTPPPRTRVLRR